GISDASYSNVSIDNTQTVFGSGSLKVDSSTGYFKLPVHTLTLSTGYAIAFWYRLNAFSTGTYSRIIEGTVTAANGNNGEVILAYPSANSGSVTFATNGPGGTNNVSDSTGYVMNTQKDTGKLTSHNK
ncbi:hypothetical protein EBT16_01855, partial [bacterium]|nr:hypothetical protein [bacterium]